MDNKSRHSIQNTYLVIHSVFCKMQNYVRRIIYGFKDRNIAYMEQ